MIVGIAGCGRMGGPMLARLRQAGFDARGFDIVEGRGDDADISQFSDGLTTLMTVVRDVAETNAVLFDGQALVQIPTLETIIVSSTLPPSYVTDLQGRIPHSITLIDAPMSGASVRARDGTLSFMLGGTAEAIAAHMPVFAAMGQSFHHMGDVGSGMAAKVLNNLLAASNTAMTRLVLDWADAAGIDEKRLLALIHTSSGQNWFATSFEEIEFARDGCAADNSIGILVKDVAAGLTMAPDGADTALPETVQNAIRALKPRKRV